MKRTRPRLQVQYRLDSSQRSARVARLVCEAFHGDPPQGHVAMFLDGDSFNCRADNLRWATRAEVAQATVARGRHRSGQHVLAERRRRHLRDHGSAPEPAERHTSPRVRPAAAETPHRRPVRGATPPADTRVPTPGDSNADAARRPPHTGSLTHHKDRRQHVTTLDTLHALLNAPRSDPPSTWTDVKVLMTRLKAERRDGTLLRQLQQERDSVTEQRLLKAIRETVSVTGNIGADYVLFTTRTDEDGSYLAAYGEVACNVATGTGYTAEVPFGDHVHNLLAERYRRVAPDSVLGVHLATGTFVLEHRIDVVRDTMVQIILSHAGSAEDPKTPEAGGEDLAPGQGVEPLTGLAVLDTMLAADPRIFVVLASFLAQRLSLHDDDHVENLIPLILDRMGAGSYVVAAARLLEKLDAIEIRGLGDRDPLVQSLRAAVRPNHERTEES
ncbi:HNH endonuclease [Amycolatopsis roodepoortensis]|uniref:HNH endonuclease signature motif containing protein n=1 Tax=Amycolatopsis roodepoortensis TaxID=700274 RepID=UPI00214B6707|nr:HNH endonuclease signature motif containing protein [Amycolatopsis roodepoortensis]UUV32164.1 HNH endonuclease [Amycolatopsis roodepoortensis]